MGAGRPKKYNEDCKALSFSFPQSLYDYLDNLATECETTRNEVAINAIMASDKDLVAKITKDQIALREAYSDIANNYNKLSNTLKQNFSTAIYTEIEEDDKLNEFFKYFKKTHAKWLEKGISDNDLLDQYEIWLYNEYKLAVKNKSLVKVVIKGWIKKQIRGHFNGSKTLL
jgi:hypothetical protein